jgi:hypothetical protein
LGRSLVLTMTREPCSVGEIRPSPFASRRRERAMAGHAICRSNRTYPGDCRVALDPLRTEPGAGADRARREFLDPPGPRVPLGLLGDAGQVVEDVPGRPADLDCVLSLVGAPPLLTTQTDGYPGTGTRKRPTRRTPRRRANRYAPLPPTDARSRRRCPATPADSRWHPGRCRSRGAQPVMDRSRWSCRTARTRPRPQRLSGPLRRRR